MHRLERTFCIWLWVVVSIPGAGRAAFDVHYADTAGEGFFDPQLGAQRRTAFEFALSIWQVRIPGAMDTNVDVSASFDPLGGSSLSATLGTGGPSEFDARFSGALRSDVAYPSPLANYLADRDLNGSRSDIDIQFNSDLDGFALGSRGWYYGLGGMGPADDIDFVTVALHELTHSLGFISTGFADGTFGADTSQGTFPDSYDLYLANAGGARLVDLSPSPQNVTQPVFWSGPAGVGQYQAAFGTGQPRIYTPGRFEEGSSLSHLDEARFTGAYDLMTPFASEAVHVPDDVVRGMMADMGWRVASTGDVDLSGMVNLLDVFEVADHLGSAYGQGGYQAALDVNQDGVIDVGDISLLAGHFGEVGILGPPLAAASLTGAPALASGWLTWPGTREAVVYQEVPEPLAAALLLVGLVVGSARRPCQRS